MSFGRLNDSSYRMVPMRSALARPLAYLYLDATGVEGLLAQTVDRLESESSTSVERAGTGKAGVTGKLKSFLLKALGGPELEVNAEVGVSQKNVQQQKHVQTVEQHLAVLLSTLNEVGKPILFTDLGEAARTADKSQTSVFVNIRE